jgi:hypothetical protein
MDTVLRILHAAGGWNHGLHLRIENPPYMALVIEATDEPGPCGLPALSVCHYAEQNDDAREAYDRRRELGLVIFARSIAGANRRASLYGARPLPSRGRGL